MDFILSYNNNEGVMTFPVITNGSVTLARDQDNPTFEGLAGQLQALGNTALASFTVESIFPMRRYPWMRPGSFDDGWYYVNTIQAVRERKIPFRAIYLDGNGRTIFNLPVSVESFEYGPDRAGDIAFRLECREYRFGKAPEVAALDAKSPAESPQVKESAVVVTDRQAAEDLTSDGYPRKYTQAEALLVARAMNIACGAVSSKTKLACVAWTVCNRKDAGQGSIYDIVTGEGMYRYTPTATTTSGAGYDLQALATDVLDRWSREHAGISSVGRVLPRAYKWFAGEGADIKFYDDESVRAGEVWDYSLPSPYSN